MHALLAGLLLIGIRTSCNFRMTEIGTSQKIGELRVRSLRCHVQASYLRALSARLASVSASVEGHAGMGDQSRSFSGNLAAALVGLALRGWHDVGKCEQLPSPGVKNLERPTIPSLSILRADSYAVVTLPVRPSAGLADHSNISSDVVTHTLRYRNNDDPHLHRR